MYEHKGYKPVCDKYLAGNCPYEEICRFSHDQDMQKENQRPSSTHTVRNDKAPAVLWAQRESGKEGTNTQSELWKWRKEIPSDATEARPLHSRLAGFFQQAQKLAAIESGVTQEVVTALASDGGLVRVKELVGRPFDTINDATLVHIFRTQVIPFYKMLSHKNVDRSALLEARVATIYVFLFSPNGDRAVAMFKATERYLRTIIKQDATDEDRSACDSCLFVMAKVMEINNSSAYITQPFVPIIQEVSALFDATASDDQQPFSRPAYKNLSKIQQRLNIGKSIPTTVDAKILVEKPRFETAQDLPGNLSDDGPRHDNDHASIQDIKIMPTVVEISAPRCEYLPGFDPSEWHVKGVEGLLDRHFRLVREDTVGQLRDAVKFELDRLQNPVLAADRKDTKFHGARTFIYDNLKFVDFGFDDFKGLEFAVSFDQPYNFREKSERQRAQMWQDSKRLGPDSLVCLIDSAGAATFMIVSLPFTHQKAGKKSYSTSHHLHDTYTRHQDRNRAHAVVRFVEYNRDTAKQVMSFFESTYRGGHMELVEFPGVLVPAFLPTLIALQKMSKTLDLPFADLILQTSTGIDKEATVAPPEYATAADFRFDLKAVSTQEETYLHVKADGSHDDFDMKEFKASTSLDSGQADALIASLSRGLAITQGPPGTGKSYTGIALTKVLLDNKSQAQLGPLLLVSYTNHALDQMLEHLVDAGVKQIVRIGSRSKSEKLSELNLKEVTKKTVLTKTERSERHGIMREIKQEGRNVIDVLQEVKALGSHQCVEAYLTRTNPEKCEQLFKLVDEEGFESVDQHPESRINRWLQGVLFPPLHNNPPRSVEELSMCDLRTTTLHERFVIQQHWASEIKLDLREDLAKSLQSYNDSKDRQNLIHTEIELRTLATANVIGVTTSGLARNLTLLRKLSSKVLISEEAGEVQEAHLLTAMLPSVEHVVLIGDHLQLRPSVQNYNLSSESTEGKQYCLDISLFERLVKPLTSTAQPLPFSTLDTQRRMHPSIADLVRSTLYPALVDAPTVTEYPEVSGMRRRLFWMNHDHRENEEKNDVHSTSKTNDWEAEMTAAVVRHLVRQGRYKPSDIAVLTPYLGQLRKLRDTLRGYYEITLSDGDAFELGEGPGIVEELDDHEDISKGDETVVSKTPAHQNIVKRTLVDAIRLSTIDNFQGEEATVVIISLVRCNENRNPGFLWSENRCNVLLSRAMHGMYIIGNAKTAASVPMWATVLERLQPFNFGDKLELCCPRHQDKSLEAASPEELFLLAPAGGCGEMCGRRLECSHSCPSFCHSDLLHQEVFCEKDCMRPPKCQHACPNVCGSKCPEKCVVIIENCSITLECGHVLNDPPCWQVHDLEKFICNEPVLKEVPGCKHKIMVPCFVDVQDADFTCPAICETELECSHTCRNDCSSCNKKKDGQITKTNHGPCKSECGKQYTTCSHSCLKNCHGDTACPPCCASCDLFYTHSRCSKSCSEACSPCGEPICPSPGCSMPCAAPCNSVPISSRCSKLLTCGCRCPSITGELCPDERFCQNCGEEEILSQQVDYVEFKEYREIDLDVDPVLVLACSHMFTMSTMDGLMNISKHYEVDETGLPTAIKAENTLEFSKDELKCCPVCRGSLRKVARYGRIVRRALLDEATMKFICWSNAKYVPLARGLMAEQDCLSDSTADATLNNRSVRLIGDRDAQVVAVREMAGLKRYGNMFRIRRQILDYQAKVHAAEQPFQRVRDMVEAVRRTTAGEGMTIAPFDFDQSLLHTKGTLLSFALLLRCDVTIMSDVLAARDKIPVIAGKNEQVAVDFSLNRSDCEKLIEDANKTNRKMQEAEGHIFWAGSPVWSKTSQEVAISWSASKTKL